MRKEILLIIFIVLFVSGCAARQYAVIPQPGVGVYHTVKRGETLWQISRYYDLDTQRIASTNRLPDKRKIYVGQKLFIPNAAESLELADQGLFKDKSFAWPVKGKIVSFYGSIEDNVKNKGIDIKTRRGVNIVASRGGTVSFVDENMKGYGKTIIIDHGDGFSTVYAHNSRILVNAGQRVTKETVIAKAGDTGRATGARLHFEIRKDKKPRNPFYYLP